MVSYSFYEYDTRVKRYAETLSRRGYKVDFFCLRPDGSKNKEIINGVKINRVRKRNFNEKNKYEYLIKLGLFFLTVLFRLSTKPSYKIIHINSVPDWLVFTAVFQKIFGAKIILDIHDLTPELYLSKFKTNKESFYYKALLSLEAWSIKFSDHVIIGNPLWREKLINRGAPPEKCTALINYPPRDLGTNYRNNRKSPTFDFVYPGTLNYHQGVDLAVKAFEKFSKGKDGNIRFKIYGRGPELTNIIKLIKDRNLEGVVEYLGYYPSEEALKFMAHATVGVVSKRANVFSDEAFSSKIIEFMGLGVPVIVPKTTIDSFFFSVDEVEFFKPNDVESLSYAMERLYISQERRKQLGQNGWKWFKKNNWEVKQSIYTDIVERLVSS